MGSLDDLQEIVFRIMSSHAPFGIGLSVDSLTTEEMGIDSLTFVAVIADLEQVLQQSLQLSILDGENSATPRILAQTIWLKFANETAHGQ